MTALDSPLFQLRIRGALACFTRPEMKVERVSYEVITPSAARGVIEAILWKPAIQWVIRRIHVLAPIRWVSFRRNEVTQRLSLQNAERAWRGGEPLAGLCVEDHRAQRNTLALRDVDYVIEAGFRMTARAGTDDNPAKFREMFARRLEAGQCFRTPYLGCREFAANVAPQVGIFEAMHESRDLGWMLHDIEFRPGEDVLPHFFNARMERGVIDVPELRPGLQLSGGRR